MVFYTQADTFIIGKLLGKELLGYYSVSMQFASLPMDKTSGIINQVAFPHFQVFKMIPRGLHPIYESVRIGSFFAFPIMWEYRALLLKLVAVISCDKWHMHHTASIA